MKFLKSAVVAAALTFVAAPAAHAVVVPFDATGPDNQTSIDFGDFVVTASSTGLGNIGPTTISQNSNGLGVDGGFIDFQPGQVDGSGGRERLTFVFDFVVALNSVDFSRFGSNDDYQLFVDGDDKGSFDDNPLLGPVQLTSFALEARGGNDRWRVESIDYTAVSAVPLPAGFLLLLSGLGAMGLVARRKSA